MRNADARKSMAALEKGLGKGEEKKVALEHRPGLDWGGKGRSHVPGHLDTGQWMPPRAPNQQDGKSRSKGRRAASLEAGGGRDCRRGAARILS